MQRSCSSSWVATSQGVIARGKSGFSLSLSLLQKAVCLSPSPEHGSEVLRPSPYSLHGPLTALFLQGPRCQPGVCELMGTPAQCKRLPTHSPLTRVCAEPGSSPFWVFPRSLGWLCWPAWPGRGMAKSSSTQGLLCQPRPSHRFREIPGEPAGLYWQE